MIPTISIIMLHGCTLNMYMLCTGNGRLYLRLLRTPCTFSDREKDLKTGSMSCKAWPILLIERPFACFSAPSSLNAFSSKKNEILPADLRK